jgi:PAS domain-containing protein
LSGTVKSERPDNTWLTTRYGQRAENPSGWGDYAFPWLDESGNLIGSVGILSDIRERKRGEEALLESNRFLRATLDALFANIALLDE